MLYFFCNKYTIGIDYKMSLPNVVAGAATLPELRKFAFVIDEALVKIIPIMDSIANIILDGPNNSSVKVNIRGVLNVLNILCIIGELGFNAVTGTISYSDAKKQLFQLVAGVVSNIQPLSNLSERPILSNHAKNALLHLDKLKTKCN